MSRDFDPTPEQQNVVLIRAGTLRQAERRIESCEHCNAEEAQIPFDWVLDRLTGSDSTVTDYILEAETRLVLPKQTEALAMPTDQRVGFDDAEGIPPVEQTRQSRQCKADGIGRPARFRFPLDKEPELLRRNRFSAATVVVGLKQSFIKVNASRKTPKIARSVCRTDGMARFY